MRRRLFGAAGEGGSPFAGIAVTPSPLLADGFLRVTWKGETRLYTLRDGKPVAMRLPPLPDTFLGVPIKAAEMVRPEGPVTFQPLEAWRNGR